MSLSIPNHKFLLDENVRIELFNFLTNVGFDVKLVPKSAPDRKIASVSIKERRVIVTNDEDFWKYSQDEIFSVVWLRIPQNNSQELLDSFQKLLKEIKGFQGKAITLSPKKWDESPLFTRIIE